MSLGYADRLKPKRNLGGQLGAQEYHLSLEDIEAGVQQLASWVASAKSVFIFTGAGISTSCGIPDFRGPKGIWTLRKNGQPVPDDFTPFEYARPSFTHQAIAALVFTGKCPYVCSQNVDGLHLRSGVPRPLLAELHGNCFAERCSSCRAEYVRDFQMETVNFSPTGRVCTAPGCGGPLVDNILDWDTPLPQDELDAAVQQAEEADVALVLGTSLQIQPANEIPVLTRDEGGKLVIVNLQKTPKDRRASLILRSRVDVVMALLVRALGLQVPPFTRNETLVVHHWWSHGPTAPGGSGVKAEEGTGKPEAVAGGGRVLHVALCSPHGPGCPLPIVEHAELEVSASCGAVVAAAAGAEAGAETATASGQADGSTTRSACGPASAEHGSSGCGDWGPCSSGQLVGSGGCLAGSVLGLPAEGLRAVRCTLRLRLVKWADEDKRDVTLHHTLDLAALPGPSDTSANNTPLSAPGTPAPQSSAQPAAPHVPACSHQVRHTFVSQHSAHDPDAVIAAFRAHPPPVVLPEPPKKRAKPTPPPQDAARRPAVLHTRNTRTAARARSVSAEAAAEPPPTDPTTHE